MWAGCGTGEDDLVGGLIACRLTLMFPQFTQGVRHGSENFIIAFRVCVSRLSEQIWTNTMKMRQRGEQSAHKYKVWSEIRCHMNELP